MTNLNQQYKDAVELYNAGKHTIAINHLYKLALLGHAWSLDAMGRLCENALGDDRFWHRAAAFWYKQSAMHGDADAMYELSRLYHHGKGVRKDDKKALKWFLASAEHGGINIDEETIQEIKRALDNDNLCSMELTI